MSINQIDSSGESSERKKCMVCFESFYSHEVEAEYPFRCEDCMLETHTQNVFSEEQMHKHLSM
jgi:hypothetical protein